MQTKTQMQMRTMAREIQVPKFTGLSNQAALTLLAATTPEPRTEMLGGHEHLVIPVIALVEGVHQACNADAPELALAAEFGKCPASWNGRPIVLGHPQKDGMMISASTTEGVENGIFGRLYNTDIKDNALVTEMWIHKERALAIGGEVAEKMKQLEAGEVLEVSIGAFMSIVPSTGTFGDGNEQFDGIWTNIIPDHLALLPTGTVGACSIADGCGTNRMNIRAAASECTCASKEPSKDGETPKSPEKGPVRLLMEKVKDLLTIRSATGMEDLSAEDIRRALNDELDKLFPDTWPWIVAVFQNSKEVVYEVGGVILMRSFTWDDDGMIQLDPTVTVVRMVTTFEPVGASEKGTTMNEKEKRIAALLANKKSRLLTSDQPALEAMTDDELKKTEEAVEAMPEAVEAKTTDEPATDPAPVSTPVVASVPAAELVPVAAASAVTTEEFAKMLPPDMQESVMEGARALKARKEAIITALQANPRNTFTPEVLQVKSLSELDGLAQLANIPDYSGRMPAQEEIRTAESMYAPEPPRLDDKSA